ncbi:MAG: hypothetical protein MJ210_04740 [Alphaproteobacteria bacterium]|nr:hypothetical protein [Alphaproteobacteria bacterium]
MNKRINKADFLVYKALQRAFDEDMLHLCLINSKVNVPGSPIYNPWEMLLPTLCPLAIGLFLIWIVGILWGLVFMVAGLLLSANVVKRKMEQRLFERAKKMIVSDYESCCNLWDFGGIVLVKAEDKKQGCIAPDGNWKDFVVLNFSDLMTEKQEDEKKKAEYENAA